MSRPILESYFKTSISQNKLGKNKYIFEFKIDEYSIDITRISDYAIIRVSPDNLVLEGPFTTMVRQLKKILDEKREDNRKDR